MSGPIYPKILDQIQDILEEANGRRRASQNTLYLRALVLVEVAKLTKEADNAKRKSPEFKRK